MTTQTVSPAIENVRGVDLLGRMLALDLAMPRDNRLNPVGSGEEVIGVLSEPLQRMYIVIDEMSREAEALIKGLQQTIDSHNRLHASGEVPDHNCEAVAKDAAKGIEAGENLDKASEAFWNLVRLNFPANSMKGLAIREGFQVVAKNVALPRIVTIDLGNLSQLDPEMALLRSTPIGQA